jgi:hypothetical protein
VDGPGGGVIKVTPSALGDGAAVARGVADALLRCRDGLLTVADAADVGDPACADALLRTARLVGHAVDAGAESVRQLAAVLEAARGTYQLADARAVTGGPAP